MSKSLAAFFASVAFIVVLSNLFWDFLPLGTTDPLYFLKVSCSAAFVFGTIGFYIGKIFEAARKVVDTEEFSSKQKDKELLIDDILIYDIGVKNINEEKDVKDDE